MKVITLRITLNLDLQYTMPNAKIVPIKYFPGAFEYLKSHPTDPLDTSQFEKSCGIGVKYSPDEIEDAVSKMRGKFSESILFTA